MFLTQIDADRFSQVLVQSCEVYKCSAGCDWKQTVASLSSTRCALQKYQRSHPKKTEIVCIFTKAARNCTGESSRSDNSDNSSDNNNSNHPGFGERHTSVTPLTKSHSLHLEVAVQFFSFYSFFQPKKNLSFFISVWIFLNMFSSNMTRFCVIKQQNCNDYALSFFTLLSLGLRLKHPDKSCSTPTAISFLSFLKGLQIDANHDSSKYSSC